jgi:hypothetical protein
MDKLLEPEKSKRVSESAGMPPAAHTIVEKTVKKEQILRFDVIHFTFSNCHNSWCLSQDG